MKNVAIHIFSLFIYFSFVSCSTSQDTPYDQAPSYEVFFEKLSPHGVWLESDKYGMVWHPNTTLEFRPYVTNGHWTATDQGWAWSSGYRWGWAAFHYGRWFYEPPYGWLWQPGYEWSPAWVTWGYVDDYYCWAPLMPGVNVTVSYSSWNPPAFYWNSCHRRHITHRNIGRVVLKPEPLAAVRPRIRLMDNYSTTRTNNQYYATGPDISEAQRYNPSKIRTTTTTDRNSRDRSLATSRRASAQKEVNESVDVNDQQPRRKSNTTRSVQSPAQKGSRH